MFNWLTYHVHLFGIKKCERIQLDSQHSQMVGFCGSVHKMCGAITTKYLASPVKYLTPYFKTQCMKGAQPVAQQAYIGPTAQPQLALITYL